MPFIIWYATILLLYLHCSIYSKLPDLDQDETTECETEDEDFKSEEGPKKFQNSEKEKEITIKKTFQRNAANIYCGKSTDS